MKKIEINRRFLFKWLIIVIHGKDFHVLLTLDDGVCGMEAQYHDTVKYHPNILLKQKDLMQAMGVSRTTLYRLRQSPNFPSQKSYNGRSLGWDSKEFFSWLNSLSDAR
jgi:predicted DNA-binding transcriptional regulator AlpA